VYFGKKRLQAEMSKSLFHVDDGDKWAKEKLDAIKSVSL
jgi:hypothetical protein